MAAQNGRPAENRRPAIQTRPSQAGARFSFLPETSEQFRNAQLHPPSPTNSDIECDTMSTLSPGLAPISRSISMIVEQRTRQQQAQRQQPQQQGQTTQQQQQQHVQYTPARYHRELQYGHQQQNDAQPTAQLAQPQQFAFPFQQPQVTDFLQSQSNENVAQYQTHSNPQSLLQTEQQNLSSDTKDPSTLQPPYYLQPPTEPHPNDLAEVKQPAQATIRNPSGTLFPAYKPPTTAAYSLFAPAAPDAIHQHTNIAQRSSPANHEWESKFCANSSCCFAFFCPCIIYGKTQHRLSQKSSGKPATDLLGYSATNSSCIIMSLACCFSGVLATVQRSRVRKAYGIEGSCGMDCLSGCCCCCCVLAQDESEIARREEKASQRRVDVGYVPPMGMTFTPPPGVGR